MKRDLGIILLAFTAAGCGEPEKPEVETKTAVVERGDITVHVGATGEIKPILEVELKSKASGLVVRFQKEPGAKVAKGELIAELDKRTERRNLTLAEANLKSAEASLGLLKLKASTDRATGASGLVAARAEEEAKKAEFKRLSELEKGLVTETDLAAARLAATLAQERTKQAAATLDLVRNRQKEDEKLAEADILKARVAVEDSQERLDDTEIRSPIDGILLSKLIEEGQIVASGISASTGGTPIAVVTDVSTMLVVANVDENDIGKVKVGQPVRVELESGSNDTFDGRVDLIPPKTVNDSNIMVVKVRIVMEGEVFGKALAGMTASVQIKVSESRNTLLIPIAALKYEKKKTVAYVPDGEGSRAVPVRKGLENDEKTEILEGLKEGETVYVSHVSLPDAKGYARLRF